jgi:hypothetical protein
MSGHSFLLPLPLFSSSSSAYHFLCLVIPIFGSAQSAASVLRMCICNYKLFYLQEVIHEIRTDPPVPLCNTDDDDIVFIIVASRFLF